MATKTKAQATRTKTKDAAISEIAQHVLGVSTLRTRKSDSLDFSEHAVWNLRDALAAAYDAGKRAATARSNG